MCVCLQQHAKDHGLEKEQGWDGGKLKSPHPGYLGGRSPQYWVIAVPWPCGKSEAHGVCRCVRMPSGERAAHCTFYLCLYCPPVATALGFVAFDHPVAPPSTAIMILLTYDAASQHKLDVEIGGKSLEEMPFYLALSMAKGTVSVIDNEVRCWGRAWCKAML